MSGGEMISRRQIICGQQQQDDQQQHQDSAKKIRQPLGPNNKQQQVAVAAAMKSRKLAGSRASSKQASSKDSSGELGQDGSSDGYAANPYEDYVDQQQVAGNGHQWRQHHHHQHLSHQDTAPVAQDQASALRSNGGYRHFDPYSIYSDEEDVWYSEERLFEDHLEEIFNKWRLLDDDIWCKLIIMERNRRIGKAYARVPIVTIDGSHELSYDGYKLALNGFDNPDRDAKTEECRKRIGKGIRIKMDNFGNILIKRLSKSGVFIKEWVLATGASGSSSSTQGSGVAGNRVMPSRQQLIKTAAAAAASSSSLLQAGASTPSGPNSSSNSSSLERANDSAICDEVISVGGLLEQDKIYVMFDMKKFQANITQELCRPYPDKRKLEQQCFSIIGLARDADDILNLPCWVMVINIVAIEMLNGRFPPELAGPSAGFADTLLLDSTSAIPTRSGHRQYQTPNFVSIFEQSNNNNIGNGNGNGGSGANNGLRTGSNNSNKHDQGNKEEDPYSLPANASSSDVKSSVNDYGTASTKNIGGYQSSHHYYQGQPGKASRSQADMYGHKMMLMRNGGHSHQGELKHRSKSNSNIYGPPTTTTTTNGVTSGSKLGGPRDRYNNSSSIYSPGHMLVPPSGDSVPPKLPPRDFVKRTKSKSSSNVSGFCENQVSMEPQNESIYSTGMQQAAEQLESLPVQANGTKQQGAARKTKRNRFLESLKAPLELAKSSAGRSASVVGAPLQGDSSEPPAAVQESAKGQIGAAKAKGFSKSSAKSNLKSFLGVASGKANKNKDTNSDDSSNYVKLNGESNNNKGTSLPAAAAAATTNSNHEADSVVDSQEEGEPDESHKMMGSSSLASYNDLDIPTPDYETDENIYGPDDGGINYAPDGSRRSGLSGGVKSSKGVNGSVGVKGGKKKHYKEDLYYSGFRAHVPQNIHTEVVGGGNGRLASARSVPKSLLDESKLCGRDTSRYNGGTVYGKTAARESIYGSTMGLSPTGATGARYRSASMQRNYTRSQAAARSHSEMYDLDTENPYAMSAGDGPMDGYGKGLNVNGGGGHRRRSASRSGYYGPSGGAHQTPIGHSQVVANAAAFHQRMVSSMANSNYDIGRSSSGIYGNNSSSSSSDYAGWHPQMRKVNSSGYLNSIFKSHHHQQGGSPNDSPYAAATNNQTTATANTTTNPLNGSSNNKPTSNPAAQGYNNSGSKQQQQRNYLATSRALKSTSANRPASNLSKQQQQQINQVTSTIVNAGPTYRSYDSSNDRDAKTEECRKRIGKGIRIKMDNFGNILIKRLSKSGVFIKEWVLATGASGSSSSTQGSGGAGNRVMPSRQQLIKTAAAAAASSSSLLQAGASTPSGPNSSSNSSSLERANDSAICDEVISVGGLLEQDKIYVMFDMKKFQANITQELCRPYPDKRKLEQQCFSIIGLARDADDILNLPCWVMVINIVAIEMLNGRFPPELAGPSAGFADTLLLDSTSAIPTRSSHRQYQTPNFVSIFEQNNNNNIGNGNGNGGSGINNGLRNGSNNSNKHDQGNKEEDPYSLPANASSSDVKSSVNDYGTASTKNIGGYQSSHHYYQGQTGKASRSQADMYGHKMMLMRNGGHQHPSELKHRSKSNCNIYGPPTTTTTTNGATSGTKLGGPRDRYNNSSSIYSPGHMLVPPSGDSVPPKLPPRDFVKRTKSKSSSNVSGLCENQVSMEPQNESIYSTGMQQAAEQLESLPVQPNGTKQQGAARKTKRNRFLESLKAPLELAKSSAGRSASVVGAPLQGDSSEPPAAVQESAKGQIGAAKTKGFSKSSAKSNLKSFLGVASGKANKNKDTNSDDSSNYVKLNGESNNNKGTSLPAAAATTNSSHEADSVVDSQEEGEPEESNQMMGSSSLASYNDLDIPTPDYETDENIYGPDDGGINYAPDGSRRSGLSGGVKSSKGVNGSVGVKGGKKKHYKEDLYYSGFRAHVPQNIHTEVVGGGNGRLASARSVPKSLLDESKLCGRDPSRYNGSAVYGKTTARESIYGSTMGLSPTGATGARYRSASMQRNYTRSQAAARSHSEMYDLDTENPYAMSAGDGPMDGYGKGLNVNGGGGHRRRSASRSGYYGPSGGAHQTPIGHSQVVANAAAFHQRMVSSMANSNYDIGRSSSGIYGNNSSSSSSDYAGWHPQMRKVNSSGYLNSIFKSHHHQQGGSPNDSPYAAATNNQTGSTANTTTNPLNGSSNNKPTSNPAAQGYNNSGSKQQQQRNYLATSRALKSTAANRPASNLSKQQQQINQVTSAIVNAGPTYRSYDSSNDSEPSYTNSSDGLDIYDHIGAHARLNHHHHQFLDLPPTSGHQQEIHVGEWENMYDR